MTGASPSTSSDFRHEALLYRGDGGFLAGVLPFVLEGLAAEEPVLVMASAARIALLRSHLGQRATLVSFVDQADLGTNPARLIPARRAFVDARGGGGGRLRGVGEPIWPGRSPVEIAECQLHEALANVAFEDAPLSLLCPYDTEGLDPAIIAEVDRSHPFVSQDGIWWESGRYEADLSKTMFGDPLAEPRDALEWFVAPSRLAELRGLIADHARRAGLDAERGADLVLAAHELAVNAATHGAGPIRVRLWRERSALVCEVHDEGRMADLLAGRRHPSSDALSGRGLWLANHLCDLVQLRSGPHGTTARLHVGLA